MALNAISFLVSVVNMTMHTGNFHRKGYLMLHHLVGATIQIANVVNYNCHPQKILIRRRRH